MIGEKLREIREKTGLNKKDFANSIGVKYTTYNNYETGDREPNSDFLIMISQKFDISIDYILGLQSEKEIKHSYELKSSEYEHIKKYRNLDPFGQETVSYILDREASRVASLQERDKNITGLKESLNQSSATLRIYTYMRKIASAGKGFYFEDIPTDTIEAPYQENADFIIGVNGDSMEPTYSDGDMVYVQKCQGVNIGEIGIFILNNECLIKEAGENGLISHNPDYGIIPGSENILCVGRVLGKVIF